MCVLALTEQKLNFGVVIKDLVLKHLQTVRVKRADAGVIANGNRNVRVGVVRRRETTGNFCGNLGTENDLWPI